MGSVFKPDIPGPSAEEIELQKAQQAALAEEERQKAISGRKTFEKKKGISSGKLGLRSLLSGGFSGFKMGG